ncbi:MAG: hypothetical protein HZC25_12635 [Rhodospirillales bacterium]|nr:hypothetical protein [Rhodospirillales bacterium]
MMRAVRTLALAGLVLWPLSTAWAAEGKSIHDEARERRQRIEANRDGLKAAILELEAKQKAERKALVTRYEALMKDKPREEREPIRAEYQREMDAMLYRHETERRGVAAKYNPQPGVDYEKRLGKP